MSVDDCFMGMSNTKTYILAGSNSAIAKETAIQLRSQKDGKSSVVFISSVAGSVGMPFHSSVSVSKAALEGLTKSLAAELAPHIRVNAIAPSLVNTPLGERFINSPEKLSAIEKRNPLRKVGAPIDIANMINFLLSDQANWITGQVIGVDGGMNHIKL